MQNIYNEKIAGASKRRVELKEKVGFGLTKFVQNVSYLYEI